MSVQVIEAVYENVALKRDIFKKLDEICKPSAVLCTNTSTINIDMVNLSVFFFHPEDLSGLSCGGVPLMHQWNPPC